MLLSLSFRAWRIYSLTERSHGWKSNQSKTMTSWTVRDVSKICQDIFRIFSAVFLLLHDDGCGRWHHTVDDVLQNVPEKKNHFIFYGGFLVKQNHCGGFIQ